MLNLAAERKWAASERSSNPLTLSSLLCSFITPLLFHQPTSSSSPDSLFRRTILYSISPFSFHQIPYSTQDAGYALMTSSGSCVSVGGVYHLNSGGVPLPLENALKNENK
ncbi:hypothetical protein EVAR_38571_1 [Eumeta japonica]|uniref:Uncharacterized protein n=1 Tax=Eumeta variegata TaxID=151549 RepID=A0A4C1WW41_EUMVA|nr:hypothetical protein EVAR_38571_1 [Eumeta japonica]